MKKVMLSNQIKDSKGFTLVELLAVMAIIGVLAAILTPIASQSGESTRDAQIRQDAGTIEGVVGTVFSERQSNAEVVTPESVTVTANINADSPGLNTQNTSSRYPELFITEEGTSTSSSVYTTEFPTGGSESDTIVVDLVVVDDDGTTLISRADLLESHTAIDFDDLLSGGFITEIPESVTAESIVDSSSYHSSLWLLKKDTSAGGETNDARSVVVLKLLTVTINEGAGTVVLSYGRIH
jgi:prepilin-type N-terminal cleavage/methylation domain-containing protein